ncbi:MAG TPA: hypothetical protein VFW93_08875 [Aquabacterium sp.]|uniref:hypothetical protein n=1 Tax=Aquabacterium sp. TaxID=1872578 RepID=UPI002E2F7940|nr:hypothetical protein [Aquabacterium sp.]HEX5356320.1 hypothetical protein [Aquabacterium sp.]
MRADWQSLVTLAIGLMAAAYLMRRWWPGFKGLFGNPATAASSGSTACGTKTTSSASCGSGCGNCGHSAAPGKDHRIRIVARDQA